MKKADGRNKVLRSFLCLIIFSALAAGLGAENITRNSSRKVKILILSKHIRLLKENGKGSITFALPKTAELSASGRRFPCKALSISFINNSFSVISESRSFHSGSYSLYPMEKDHVFFTEIDGEKRVYPLPLHIKFSGDGIELSVEEKVNQYAIDSAHSEIGSLQPGQTEALYALALIIKARAGLPHLTGKHAGYDFCDLTCCQTYRGRSGKNFDTDISIDTAGITGGLFFHSSSGGRLFTESIFNKKERTLKPPEDFLYSENLNLSRNNNPSWEASISPEEISPIIYPGNIFNINSIRFDPKREILITGTGQGEEIHAPETFRIKINRVKGWNFIKSNNYSIAFQNGMYTFTGSGLGHGVGLSLEGAVELAGRGYSRYEIAEHYYPGLRCTSPAGNNARRFQYILFNNVSGEILQSNTGISFLNRTIPCGSLFKLFIAIYLSERRNDLFYNYSYKCKPEERDKFITRQCWNKTGHGQMDLRSALSHSCNKYFASLYRFIDQRDFLKWLEEFTLKLGIKISVPHIKDPAAYSDFLAGLNFNLAITIDGIIKLNRYIYYHSKENSSEEIKIIFRSLMKTFTEGTASSDRALQKKNLSPLHYNSDITDLWGKTGTVIAGTNSHHGYGLFTGGSGSTGIVSILMKGTGAETAEESKKILNAAPYTRKVSFFIISTPSAGSEIAHKPMAKLLSAAPPARRRNNTTYF